MSDPITVSTTVNVSAHRAWVLWTIPEHIVHWNNASDDWHTPQASNDLQVGGKFVFTMAARDGSFSFDFSGIYSEVVDNQRIAYAMPDGREVVVTFAEQDGNTVVTETFDPENDNPLEMQQAGWQAILDNFKRYAEGVQ
jgi:uncharacterized protein YndB with AHSA1/START domain